MRIYSKLAENCIGNTKTVKAMLVQWTVIECLKKLRANSRIISWCFHQENAPAYWAKPSDDYLTTARNCWSNLLIIQILLA